MLNVMVLNCRLSLTSCPSTTSNSWMKQEMSCRLLLAVVPMRAACPSLKFLQARTLPRTATTLTEQAKRKLFISRISCQAIPWTSLVPLRTSGLLRLIRISILESEGVILLTIGQPIRCVNLSTNERRHYDLARRGRQNGEGAWEQRRDTRLGAPHAIGLVLIEPFVAHI